MKIRLAVVVLLMSLAMFAVVLRLKQKPNPIQKPNPATAWNPKPDATNSMDLVYTMPKGEHNNGWCSNDMQSWWPARANSMCYEDDKKYGTCEFPSITEPWCDDRNGGDDGQSPALLNQAINEQNRRKN